MARVRKLLITLGCGSALYSSLVPALGLGDITLHSALSQPLNADIELLEVGDLSASEVKVGLASADEFNRAGVDRFFILNDLRFIPVMRGNKSYIKVVSTKSINEPYLNFLVEVARPNGRLLREYTLLLDPPGTAPAPGASQAVSVQDAPVAASSRSSRSGGAAATSNSPRKQAAAVAPVVASMTPPAATEGKRYTVAPGDSLWSIAKRLRDAGSTASLNDLMQGIHALNPQAFVGNDRTRLKAGQSLLLPDGSPASVAINSAAANGAGQSTAAAVPSSPSTAVIPANAAAPVATQAALDAASSQLNGAVLENRQLHKALVDLQQQVDTLKQQMNSKDQQVAALQTAVGQAPASPPAATAPGTSGAAPAAGASGAPGSAAPAPASGLSNSAATTIATPVPALTPAAQAAANPPPAAVVIASPPITAPVSKPEQVAANSPTTAESSSGLFILLAGGLAVLVALLGLVFLARRTRREDRLIVIAPVELDLEEAVSPVQVKTVESVPAALSHPAVLPVVADVAVASAAAVASVAAAAEIDEDLAPTDSLEPASATAADALDGASIYIAYGRYNEAFAVLRAAIGKEPERFDLRLRLLDVLGHQNDSATYAVEEQGLLEMGHNEIQLQHLRARFPKLLSAAAAAASATSAPVAQTALQPQEAAAAPIEPAEDKFHLNLDDLSLDADWDNLSPFDATPSNRAKAAEAKAQVAAENSTFHSNLTELPEVFELHDEFLEEPDVPVANKSEKDALDDQFLDSFIAESDMFNTGPLEIDFDQLNSQESATKLDLAQAFIEQGDVEGASHLLQEVIIEGDDELKQEARELLSRIA